MASFNKNIPVPSRQSSITKTSNVATTDSDKVMGDRVAMLQLFDKIKFLQQDLISLSQKVNELPPSATSSNIIEFQELLEQEKYKNDLQETRLLNLEMEVMRLKDKR